MIESIVPLDYRGANTGRERLEVLLETLLRCAEDGSWCSGSEDVRWLAFGRWISPIGIRIPAAKCYEWFQLMSGKRTNVSHCWNAIRTPSGCHPTVIRLKTDPFFSGTRIYQILLLLLDASKIIKNKPKFDTFKSVRAYSFSLRTIFQPSFSPANLFQHSQTIASKKPFRKANHLPNSFLSKIRLLHWNLKPLKAKKTFKTTKKNWSKSAVFLLKCLFNERPSLSLLGLITFESRVLWKGDQDCVQAVLNASKANLRCRFKQFVWNQTMASGWLRAREAARRGSDQRISIFKSKIFL